MQQKVQNRHQEWIRRKELGVLYPLYQGMTLGSVPFHYPDSSEYNQCLFDFYGSEYFLFIVNESLMAENVFVPMP